MKKAIIGLATLATVTGMALLAIQGKKDVQGPENTAPQVEEMTPEAQKLLEWYKKHPTARIYIQTDKPMYNPGESIWFKCSAFTTKDIRPISEVPFAEISLYDSKGAKVVSKNVGFQDGAGVNDIIIPASAIGGEYSLKAKVAGGPEVEKKLIINRYTAPAFKKSLNIHGKAYAPGARLTADADFHMGTGEAMSYQDINLSCRLDGKVIKNFSLKTDKDGKTEIALDLPGFIKADTGYLTLSVSKNGISESITRQFSVLNGNLDLSFYPEGGDLVNKLPARIYFKAARPDGKAAEIQGVVLDENGKELQKFSSFHHGMGSFRLSENDYSKCKVKITSPAGIKKLFRLPPAHQNGLVMSTEDDLSFSKENVKLKIYSSQDIEGIRLISSIREEMVTSQTVNLKKGANTVSLKSGKRQGVMRISLLDSYSNPLCERVIYRNRDQNMQIRIVAEKNEYMPRQAVNLSISTTLPDGSPVPADLAISVVDDRVLSYADDKSANILARLYLEKDLHGEVEEVNFYFDKKEEKSARAMDLLMGTRGWRKFEWKNALQEKDVRLTDQIFYNEMKDHLAQLRGRYEEREQFRKFEMAAGEVVDENVLLPMAINEVLNDPQEKPAAEPAQKEDRANKELAKIKAMEEVLDLDDMQEKDMEFEDKKRDRYRYSMFAAVRVFPQVKYSSTKTDVRTDFRQTLLWAPRVKTDSFGNAKVSFYLNDSITSFKIKAEGASQAGGAGSGELSIESRLPLYSDIRMPFAFSAGDKIELPIILNNETSTVLSVATALKIPAFMKGSTNLNNKISIDAKSGKTLYLPFTLSQGTGKIDFSAEASGLFDRLNREISVYPAGFPVEGAVSGNIKGTKTFNIDIPEKVVSGSINAKLEFYPSPTSSLLSGIEGMLREPCGCFEQTSSSTYPNIVILNYLRENEISSPEIEKKALDLLKRGYSKLTGFECKEKGYEWFGQGAGHEALTAYGLMEFKDMAKVTDIVDMDMVKRTALWMLQRRNEQGGFKRNDRALDTFGNASPEVTDAYITWAMTEAGLKNEIDKEIKKSAESALKTKDAYRISMALLAVVNSKLHINLKDSLLNKLRTLKTAEGFYKGEGRSITSSTGTAFDIEATSLAVMAQLRCGTQAAVLNDSVSWLLKGRSHGSFGATQSTILALKCLTEYATASRVTQSAGDIYVKINGQDVRSFHFEKGHQGAIKIEGLAEWLNIGQNQVEITVKSNQALPFSMNMDYNTLVPNQHKECTVRMELKTDQTEVKVGELYAVDVELKNISETGIGSTMVRVGVPAGLEKNLKQLQELKKEGKIASFETTAREVILYFRGMAPQETKNIPLRFNAAYPGEFTGKASSAYEYYTKDKKWWINPLQVKINK